MGIGGASVCAGVCTLAALLGEKDESVRENERMRLTRALRG